MMNTRAIAVAALLLALGACAAETGADMSAPRDRLGQQVDPKTGLPAPGSPPIGGGY